MKKLIIIQPQHRISFCKDDVFIDGYKNKKASIKIDSLSANEIAQIIKTLNYTLENKQMIFESLEKYITTTLNNKIATCSKEIDVLESNLNFIKNINL